MVPADARGAHAADSRRISMVDLYATVPGRVEQPVASNRDRLGANLISTGADALGTRWATREDQFPTRPFRAD